MQKNVAGQYINLFVFDSTTSKAKTGDAANLVFYVALDNGSPAAITSNSGVPTEISSTHAKGWYIIALSQAETNADMLTFTGVSSTTNIEVVGNRLFTEPPNFNSLTISSGIVSADIKKTDGIVFHAYDGTFAAVTAGTDVTFPTTDALSNSIPNDARYAYCVFKLVGGTGAGQLLLTGAKTGTRKFAFLSAVTPVDPSTDTTYVLLNAGSLPGSVASVTDRVTANSDQIGGNATAATNFASAYAGFETGTAQTGSTSSTIKIRSGASSTNDIFKNQGVFILSGTGSGQTNKITAYNGTTKVATIETTWVVTPDNTSVYIILGRIE